VRAINFDESGWTLVIVSERSIADRGTEADSRLTGAELKACFTFFAIYSADESKFPLIFLAKGRTGCCHEQFGSLGYHVKYGINPEDSITKI
jgi:hypothetical protein